MKVGGGGREGTTPTPPPTPPSSFIGAILDSRSSFLVLNRTETLAKQATIAYEAELPNGLLTQKP